MCLIIFFSFFLYFISYVNIYILCIYYIIVTIFAVIFNLKTSFSSKLFIYIHNSKNIVQMQLNVQCFISLYIKHLTKIYTVISLCIQYHKKNRYYIYIYQIIKGVMKYSFSSKFY